VAYGPSPACAGELFSVHSCSCKGFGSSSSDVSSADGYKVLDAWCAFWFSMYRRTLSFSRALIVKPP